VLCLETAILAYKELRILTGSNFGARVWIDCSQVSLFDMHESSVGTWSMGSEDPLSITIISLGILYG
jgi:hypothetical protein